MALSEDEIDLQIYGDIKELMGAKFSTMLEKYLENSAKYITQTEDALNKGEVSHVADSVHPLKSSSASLGIVNVAALAKEIEEQARSDSSDLEALSPLMERLKTSFANIEGPLREEISAASGN